MRKWQAYSFVIALLYLIISIQPLHAIAFHYMATPAQAQWEMTSNTPLICQLVHPIPNFGEAVFTSEASKKINLDFKLKMLRPMGETANVSLVSMPPYWRAGERAVKLNNLKFFKQFDGYVGDQTAWTLLSELSKGRYPTFSYKNWNNNDELIEVSLSSVLFKDKYQVFSSCIANLLKYSFEDIAFTILHYEKEGDRLTSASQDRLAKIAEYVKYNQDIELVLISAYTDNSDSSADSQFTSSNRAKSLGNYFKNLGLADIQLKAYGQRRPIDDNANPLGKAQNRRVVISLGRD